MRRSLLLLALLGPVACMDPEMPAPVLGEWGGEHLGLVATVQGAELEFDCATGRTTEAITPDASGRFSVAGFHSPGHGGPIREGEETVEYSARFDGSVRGDLMTMSITVPGLAMTLGSFTLLRGASPRVFKCL
jgi:hypothetical protein